MFDLTGKTALVTGATGGIGGAIARAFHQAGATVAVSGRQTDKLEALKGELGDRIAVVPCDLSDREAVGKLVDGAIKAVGGRLDIIVNNAGLTKDNLFMVMKDDQWDDVIAVNLTSTFMICRAGSRHMMRSKTGFGRIINIASISGVFGNPGQGNYAASKAGMIGMTKSLAREVASRGDHGQLHRAGVHRNGDDGCSQRNADHRDQEEHSGSRVRQTGGYRCCRALFGEPRGRLCHRPDAARQWRHGDDLARCGGRSACPGPRPSGGFGPMLPKCYLRRPLLQCGAARKSAIIGTCAGAHGCWPRAGKCVNEPLVFGCGNWGKTQRPRAQPMPPARDSCTGSQSCNRMYRIRS